MKTKLSLVVLLIWLFLLGPGGTAGWAGEHDDGSDFPEDLTELSLEDLMDMSVLVTYLSKKEQNLFDSAYATYVLTQEDIRRSGAINVPEVLRMVPGLIVSRVDSNKWTVGARGYNNQYGTKILVMIDDRSLYSPLYSGIYWDMQLPLLEDVKRIEVMRGPVAAMWGANAVNGIINIITAKAEEAQGGLLAGGYGTEERGFAGARYGGKAGEDVYYKVYGKYFNKDQAVDQNGHKAGDDWDGVRGGFRTEWNISDHDAVMFEGDIYQGTAGVNLILSGLLESPYTLPARNDADFFGGNILTRWNHDFSKSSRMALQVYYDRTEREDLLFGEKRDTVDFDSQHNFGLGERQEIVWGLGYRLTTDDIHNSQTFSIDPDNRDIHVVSAFINDDINFMEERLNLSIGSKFEYNDFTGFEFQPNIRILGKPHEDHRVWAAVSRAVRTPSRMDDDVRFNYLSGFYTPEYLAQVIPPEVLPAILTAFPDGVVGQVSGFGNHDFESEELWSAELGYRVKPVKQLFADIATFYNMYDNLWTTEPGVAYLEMVPITLPHLVVPIDWDNRMDGESYGVEFALNWDVVDWWRLAGGYTWMKLQLHLDKSSNSYLGEMDEDIVPQNQLTLRSYIDLPYDFELDAMAYYVDNLAGMNVDSYTRLDLRLGWSPVEDLHLELVSQNLLDAEHLEFSQVTASSSTQVQRAMYGKIIWQF